MFLSFHSIHTYEKFNFLYGNPWCLKSLIDQTPYSINSGENNFPALLWVVGICRAWDLIELKQISMFRTMKTTGVPGKEPWEGNNCMEMNAQKSMWICSANWWLSTVLLMHRLTEYSLSAYYRTRESGI